MSTKDTANPPPLAPETLLAQGLAHEKTGAWNDARRCYNQALRISPQHAEANHRLGVLIARRDGFAASLPFLKAALDVAPGKARNWLVLSEALLKAGKALDALKIIDAGIDRGLDLPSARALRERILVAIDAAKIIDTQRERETLGDLFRNHQFDEAARLAATICEHNPQATTAWKVRGASLHALGRFTEATKVFREGFRANPADAELAYNLGNLLREQGQGDEAVAAYRQALSINPQLLSAHLNLAGLLRQLTRLDEAESTYRRALDVDPDNADAQAGLGHVLRGQGRSEDAAAVFAKAIELRPAFAEAHTNLGNVLRDLGRLQDAEAAHRRALALAPDSATAHNNLGVLLHEQGRVEAAEAALRKALALNPRFVDAALNLGSLLRDTNQLPEALLAYRQAFSLAPDDEDAILHLGNLLRDLGHLRQAEAHYRQVLAKKPNRPAALNNLGIILQTLGKYEAAEATFRQALEIDPSFVDAHANLLDTLERSNRINLLRDQLAIARRACGNHAALALAQARLHDRDGDLQQARQDLEAIDSESLPPQMQFARIAFLGDLCDRLNDTDSAFAYFFQHNRMAGGRVQTQGIDKGRFLARIQTCSERFTKDWIDTWSQLRISDERPDPIFLIGFPRSGTTLLDTILRGHEAISVVEEKPAVLRLRETLRNLPFGDPDGLANLDERQTAELRQAYFQELDRHIDQHRPIQIDKLPLNAVEIGLLQRVFPQARFLLALRHPCDCVLSCFMHDFRLNDAMANFLTLEDTANLYDKVMSVTQQYCDALSPSLHRVRYEMLVTDPKAEIEPVLDFLGVSWSDAVLDHVTTARRRDRIQTPSYNQVNQPLYTRAAGRWTRYRRHLDPVLPILQPWIRHFGYEAGESTE